MTDSAPPPLPEAPIRDELGAEILERTNGRAVIRFPVERRFTIPSGVLQGGMYAVMMDMAMASAAGGGLSTTTLQVNLLRPAREGNVIVTADIVRQGRTVIYLEAEMRDEEGALLARGNQTGMVVQPYVPPAEPE